MGTIVCQFLFPYQTYREVVTETYFFYFNFMYIFWLVNVYMIYDSSSGAKKYANALPNFTQKSMQPMWLYNEKEF